MKTENILVAAAGFAVGAMLFKSGKVSGVGSVDDIELRFPNYHVLKVKYMPATNYAGSRVKIISERFEQSKTIDYDHRYNGTKDVAAAWLIQNGFNVIGAGEAKDGYYIISDTFKPLKGE